MVEEQQKIYCRAIIEVLGKPKEHVEEMLKKYIDEIKEDEKIKVLKANFEKATEVDNIQEDVVYYTAFAEIEISTDSFSNLIGFCFDYMPSSIEIIKPEVFVLKNRDVTNMLNDLQARSHELDSLVKQLKSENNFLKRNTKSLLKNIILISLKINNLTLDKLASITGVKKEELVPFLEELIKEEIIEKLGEEYMLRG